VVVELDPEALEQLLGILAVETAVFEALLVEGLEVLIEVSRVERVPAVELGDDAEVVEPVGLERFPEVGGSVGGDPLAVARDPQ
jgi:hypothetical protein